MSNNINKMKAPTLRFPEFRDTGKWSYVNGNIVFEQISNKNHASDLPILAITQEQGAIPRELIDYNVSVTDKSVESYKVVEVEDFIISLRSFQGGIEYSSYKGICSPAYVILRKKIEGVNSFFKHYLKTSTLDFTRFCRQTSTSKLKLLKRKRAQLVKMAVPSHSIIESLNVIKYV